MKIIAKIPPVVTSGEFVAIDLEVFGMRKGHLHRPEGTFACASIAIKDKVYQIYDEAQIKQTLKNLEGATWVFHNSLFDLRQLRRYTTIKPRFIWDTQLVDQSMFGGLYRHFSLKSLVRRWLKLEMKKEVREEFSTASEMTDEMKEYAAMDSVLTLQIAELQFKEFNEDPAFKAYTDFDEPSIFPALDMKGFSVDADLWRKSLKEFSEKATQIQSDLGFNVKSPDNCKLALAKTGVRVTSTGAEVLLSLKGNAVADGILEGRLYRDALSKYGEKWLENHVEEDRKVYASYHITGAKSGRQSCSDPNMQNIPARKLPIYRSFFVPSEGGMIIVADAASQEPCILAYASQDVNLIKALGSGISVHLAVAREMFDDNTITKDDTEKYLTGKALNLGLSYGLSAYGLANRRGITEQQADDYIRKYFTRFSGVHAWIGSQRNFAFRTGFVTTPNGRKMFINPYERKWMNNAINSPIQGGASDFTKMWVRKIWEYCRKAKVEFALVAIVHDEVVMDVPKKLKAKYLEILNKSYNDTAKQLFSGVPFRVEIECGRSWGAKQIKEEQMEDEEDE